MNSVEFVIALARKLQVSKLEASTRLDELVAVVTAELIKNNTVSIPNFGSFEVKKRDERISVHPMTGNRMLVPPKLMVKYKASPSLKDRIKESHE